MNAELDLVIRWDGSMVVVTPLTNAASLWIDENLQLEGWQWLGRSFAVDVRFISDLVAGMTDAGLLVGGTS